MRRDSGEDEKRKGRAPSEVRQDRRGDYLPRGPRENISGLYGGEDGGEDGGMQETCVEVLEKKKSDDDAARVN